MKLKTLDAAYAKLLKLITGERSVNIHVEVGRGKFSCQVHVRDGWWTFARGYGETLLDAILDAIQDIKKPQP